MVLCGIWLPRSGEKYSRGTAWADPGPTLFCIRGFLLGSLDQPYGGAAPTDWTADFEARRITDLAVFCLFLREIFFQNVLFRTFRGPWLRINSLTL